jgi:hypothetical protein
VQGAAEAVRVLVYACRMAFDDVAKRMRETHGRKLGDTSRTTDPDQIIADAMKSDRQASRISNLVLGPMLLLGGAGIAVLCYLVARQGRSCTAWARPRSAR